MINEKQLTELQERQHVLNQLPLWFQEEEIKIKNRMMVGDRLVVIVETFFLRSSELKSLISRVNRLNLEFIEYPSTNDLKFELSISGEGLKLLFGFDL